MLPTTDQPDATCRACRTRDCCSASDVLVTGPDVVRIARALATPPIAFCRALPAGDPARPDAFTLDGGAERWVLALRRREAKDGRLACVFLVELNTRRRLCGLDALAPAACHAFPVIAPDDADPADAEVAFGAHRGPGCWRDWSVDEVDAARARTRVRQLAAERQAHRDAVAAWNVALEARPGSQPLETFVDHLMNRFAAPAHDTPFDAAAGLP